MGGSKGLGRDEVDRKQVPRWRRQPNCRRCQWNGGREWWIGSGGAGCSDRQPVDVTGWDDWCAYDYTEATAMKGKKRMFAALVLCSGLFGASAANAGIPVIDAANLVQAIQQVIAWGQQQLQMGTQIQNQVSQIQNQATQIARITGTRNLGQVFNNPLLQQVVPANVYTCL